MSKQQDAIRDARALGVPKMLILGLQHMFAMFGATILVPILVNVYFEGEGLSIQVTLICAGLGTCILRFFFCVSGRVPDSSTVGQRYLCRYDHGGKAALCLRRYCDSGIVLSGAGTGY